MVVRKFDVIPKSKRNKYNRIQQVVKEYAPIFFKDTQNAIPYNPAFKPKGKLNLSDFTRRRIKDNEMNEYLKGGCLSVYKSLSVIPFIYLDNDKVVASVMVDKYHRYDGSCFIWCLDVLEDYRGYGLSTQIIDEMVNEFDANAIKVDIDNILPINIYQKYGFEFWDDPYEDNEKVCTLYLPEIIQEIYEY